MSGRLAKLYLELTAKERALLVLRAWKQGKEEDPGWRSRMPQRQVKDFNRFIHLMNGVNRELGLYLFGVHHEAEKLSLRLGWLGALFYCSVMNRQLGSPEPEGTLDQCVDLQKTILREGIQQRWRELQAVNAVVAEVAEKFDGEDPTIPKVRGMLEGVEERLREVHEGLLDYAERFDLPEPGEDLLAEVRGIMEDTVKVVVTP